MPKEKHLVGEWESYLVQKDSAKKSKRINPELAVQCRKKVDELMLHPPGTMEVFVKWPGPESKYKIGDAMYQHARRLRLPIKVHHDKYAPLTLTRQKASWAKERWKNDKPAPKRTRQTG